MQSQLRQSAARGPVPEAQLIESSAERDGDGSSAGALLLVEHDFAVDGKRDVAGAFGREGVGVGEFDIEQSVERGGERAGDESGGDTVAGLDGQGGQPRDAGVVVRAGTGGDDQSGLEILTGRPHPHAGDRSSGGVEAQRGEVCGAVDDVDRVLDLTGDRGALCGGDVVVDPHLHAGLHVGKDQEYGSSIARELHAGDLDPVSSLGPVTDLVVARSVRGGSAVVPALDAVAAGVGGLFLVEWPGEADHQSGGHRRETFGEVQRFAGGPDPVQPARAGLVARPSEQPADVQLAIVGMKTAAVDAGGQLGQRQPGDAPLVNLTDPLVDDPPDAAGAVREAQQRAPGQGPVVAVDPDRGTRAAVRLLVNPAQGRVVAGVLLARHIRHHVAVEAAGADPVDPVHRRPVTFLVGRDEAAVVVERQAVGGTEPVGQDLAGRAVGRNADDRTVLRNHRRQRVTGSLHIVEVALLVGLQVHGELVEVLGDLGVVVEVLVEVGFTVVVQVDQASDLVAAEHVDPVVDDFQAQRLKQPGGDPLPGQLAGCFARVERLAESRDDPDVTLPGADGCPRGVAEVVEASQPHPAPPRVVRRQSDLVDGQGTPGIPAIHLRSDRLLPLRGATGGRVVPGGASRCLAQGRGGGEGGLARAPPGPDRDPLRGPGRGDLQSQRFAGGQPPGVARAQHDGCDDRLGLPVDGGRWPGRSTRPDADLGLSVELQGQPLVPGNEPATAVGAGISAADHVAHRAGYLSAPGSLLVKTPACNSGGLDLLITRQLQDLGVGQRAVEELDLVESALQRSHEVGGGVAQPDDVFGVVGRLQGLGTVGFAVEEQPCSAGLVRVGDRDMVPLAVVDRPLPGDHTDPADIKAQPASPDKKRLTLGDPGAAECRLAENRSLCRAGADPGRDREVA